MSPNIDITIILDSPRWADLLPHHEDIIRDVVNNTLLAVGKTAENAQLSVVLADDEFLQRYNKQYRGKDHATNVLAFPADNSIHFADDIVNYGDILIALSTVEWEATEQGKPFADHFKHMLVHGVLHLLGYDHQDEQEAQKMEGLEISILQSLGVHNPYER